MTNTLTLDTLVEEVKAALVAAGWAAGPRHADGAARAALAAVAKRAGGVPALNASALILLDGVDSDHSKIVADHIAALLRTLAEAAHD